MWETKSWSGKTIMEYHRFPMECFLKPPFKQKARNHLYNVIFKNLQIRSVFEIGVGYGEFARYCRAENMEYAGAEQNDYLRNGLCEEGFNVLPGTAPEIPVLGKKFDCLFASHLIEHLNDYDEVIKLIKNAEKILNRDGYIIFLYSDSEKHTWTFFDDSTHPYLITKKRVEKILKNFEFKIIKSEYVVGGWVKPARLLYFMGKNIPYKIFSEKIKFFLKLHFPMSCFTVAQMS